MKKKCKNCLFYKIQEYKPTSFNDCYRGCSQIEIEKSKDKHCDLWQKE